MTPSDDNTPPPANAANDEALLIELHRLREEHADLGQAIEALTAQPGPDLFVIARLKKKKLQLKDRMAFIEDQLTPDIIA